MFLYQNQSDSQSTKKNEVTASEAVGVLGIVLAIVGYQKFPLLKRFYFQHFEEIYLIAGILILAVISLIIFQIKKRTKVFAKRAKTLEQVWSSSDGILAGKTDDGVTIHIPEEIRTGHVQILGATGKGKTKSVVEAWASRDIMKGKSILVIDGKGDPELSDNLKSVAAVRGIVKCKFEVFDLGNPKDSNALNPLQYGSAQQITDRIFTAFDFLDPYYKAVQYDITGSVIRLIQEIDFYEYRSGTEYKKFPGIVTFKRLFELLTSDEKLALAISQSQDDVLVQKLTNFMKDSKENRNKKLSGLLSQIGPFAEGEVSELVNGGDGEIQRRCTNVSELFLGRRGIQRIFVILIPTLKYQQIGHQLGKLLFQELGWAVGERASNKDNPNYFTPVYLDEFSSFVYPGFTNSLNKARSSNVALHLSHQSLGDLSQVSPDFAKIINTNTNIKCILGLNDPETADWMARHLGTSKDEKITERAHDGGLWSGKNKTGEISIREVEAYKIHPNTLKNFMNGKGVIHMPTALGNLTEEIQFMPFEFEEIETERGF